MTIDSRRDALLAAAVAAPPSNASVPTDPLTALGEQCQEAYDNWLQFDTSADSIEERKARERRAGALGKIAWKLEDQAAKVPAQSIAGVLVYLRMAGAHCHLMERTGRDWNNTYAQLTWQAWDSLERMARGTVRSTIQEPVISEPLLALERRMRAVQSVIDEPGQDAPESVTDEWASLQDQVAEMPAVSVAGLAVKLRLMRANTAFLDGFEFGDKLIDSTVESAERMAGQVVTPPSGDAAFFDALAEYDRLLVISQNLERRKEVFRPGIPETKEAEEAYEASYDKAMKAWERTRSTPTTTRDGLFAKLKATVRFMDDLQQDELYEAEWKAIKSDMERIAGPWNGGGEARP